MRLQNKHKKCIVFDFDGTLADSEQALLESIRALNIPQFAQISKNDISSLKQLGMKDALKKLQLPLYQLPSIVLRAQQEMKNRLYDIKIFPGIAELLRSLKEDGNQLGILTSNSAENVKVVLSSQNVESVFDFIHSEKNLFGKDKPLTHILKKYNLEKSEVVYIGDEVRDFDACQKVGVDMIGVRWGFNSADVLRKHGVEKIAESPGFIPDLIRYTSSASSRP